MEYISRNEASQMIDVSKQTIQNYIDKGYITARVMNGKVWLEKDSVERFAKENLKVIHENREACEEYRKGLEEATRNLRRASYNFMRVGNMKTYFFYGREIYNFLVRLSKRADCPLQNREMEILQAFFKSGSNEDIAAMTGLCGTRINQIFYSAMKKLEKAVAPYDESEIIALRARCKRQHDQIVALEEKLNKAGICKHKVINPQHAVILNKRVFAIGFSVRLTNCLLKADIRTVGELVKHSMNDFMALRNFGHTTKRELQAWLDKVGLKLNMDVDAYLYDGE